VSGCVELEGLGDFADQ
ncbi:hypothetical protein A2U01_0024414, partial [Trifolium medium]|nr:hypothetical protein [Trifolium medium]